MQLISVSYKALRKEKRLSLHQAGKILNMDPSLVSRIENNLRQPTREQLMNIAKLYELDPDALLVDWLSDKVVQGLQGEKLAKQVLKAAELKITS